MSKEQNQEVITGMKEEMDHNEEVVSNDEETKSSDVTKESDLVVHDFSTPIIVDGKEGAENKEDSECTVGSTVRK